MPKSGHVILVNGTDLLGRGKGIVARLLRRPLQLPGWMSPADPVPGTSSALSTAAPAGNAGTTDEHALYRAIRDCFAEDRVHHFMWNGHNSHKSRLAASKLLAEDIKLLLATGPVYVIGHSHGGNVALYALRQLQSDPECDEVGLAQLQIITLSTPFLAVFREGIGAVFWGGVVPVAIASFVAVAQVWSSLEPRFTWPRVAAVGALATVFIWAATTRNRKSTATEVGNRRNLGPLPIALALVTLLTVGWATTRTGFSVMPSVARFALMGLLAWLTISALGWLAYGFMWRSQSDDLVRRVDELAMPNLGDGASVHVVRTVADEAEGFLVVLLLSAWIGLLFTNLSRLLPLGVDGSEQAVNGRFEPEAHARRRRPWKVWRRRAIVCTFVILPFLAWTPRNGSAVVWILWLPALAAGCVLFGSVLRWAATAVGLGPSHSPLIWFYGTSVEAVPSGSVPLTQVGLSKKENRNAYRFTHSSYENYDCIDAILDVIDPERQCPRVPRPVSDNL